MSRKQGGRERAIFFGATAFASYTKIFFKGAIMVGFSHRIQVRQILTGKKDVADLLKSTISEIKSETGRVQLLMKLAEKYSICRSKNDGGNLGWIELSSDDPRMRKYDPVLKNHALESLIREGVRNLSIQRGKINGPFSTDEGYHIIIVCNEFGAELSNAFTGSSI